MLDYFENDYSPQTEKLQNEKKVIQEVIKIWNALQNKRIYNFDLKPENIMIKKKDNGKGYDIKLIDFTFANKDLHKPLLLTSEPLYGFFDNNFLKPNWNTYYKYVKLKFVLKSLMLIKTERNNDLKQLVNDILYLGANQKQYESQQNFFNSFQNFFYDNNEQFKEKDLTVKEILQVLNFSEQDINEIKRNKTINRKKFKSF